jgi:hypothetical protein
MFLVVCTAAGKKRQYRTSVSEIFVGTRVDKVLLEVRTPHQRHVLAGLQQ